jgi:hypothetical protein
MASKTVDRPGYHLNGLGCLMNGQDSRRHRKAEGEFPRSRQAFQEEAVS